MTSRWIIRIRDLIVVGWVPTKMAEALKIGLECDESDVRGRHHIPGKDVRFEASVRAQFMGLDEMCHMKIKAVSPISSISVGR